MANQKIQTRAQSEGKRLARLLSERRLTGWTSRTWIEAIVVGLFVAVRYTFWPPKDWILSVTAIYHQVICPARGPHDVSILALKSMDSVER